MPSHVSSERCFFFEKEIWKQTCIWLFQIYSYNLLSVTGCSLNIWYRIHTTGLLWLYWPLCFQRLSSKVRPDWDCCRLHPKMYGGYQHHKNHHSLGKSNTDHYLLKARNIAFKSGNTTDLWSARARMKAIRMAKIAHGQKFQSHFQDQQDTKILWREIQSVTAYRSVMIAPSS